ncbi:MAG: DUF5134 domain-containing protein [Novosphingobium sp.]|nr:DUF5134 domain-containing protein [Novosphingobium sp.]
MTTSIPLMGVFVAAALLSVWEFLRRGERPESYLADREAHGAHVVMNGAMAAMVAPGYDGTVERAVFWVLLLGAMTLILRLALAVQAGTREKAIASGYHAVAMFAMVYAVVLMPAAAMHHAGGMHHAMPTPWIASVFGILFLLDGVATVVAAVFFPARMLGAAGVEMGSGARKALIGDLRRSAIPHVVMDAGMAWMLL